MKRSIPELTSSYFKKLPLEFYNQPSTELGKALLGKVLARKLPTGEILRGTIVETEAYPGAYNDPASHSYSGRKTSRNGAMFMDPGTSYVYFIYGMYNCFNVSSAELGGACLIRAVEPLEDYQIMHHLRDRPAKKTKKTDNDNTDATAMKPKKTRKLYELCNGPGKLCLAFDIVRDSCDKIDLTTSDVLWIEPSDDDRFCNGGFEMQSAKRVGLDSQPEEARNQLWRYFVTDNLAVSTAKPSQIIKKLDALSQAYSLSKSRS